MFLIQFVFVIPLAIKHQDQIKLNIINIINDYKLLFNQTDYYRYYNRHNRNTLKKISFIE